MRALLLTLLAAVWPAPASAQDARASATLEPLTEEPVVRWSYGPFAFEDEPALLSPPEGERVLASGRDPTGRRALVVLEGADGRVLSRLLFAAKAPLEVVGEGERAAVRTAPGRIDVYRLRGARLLLERSFVHPSSVSTPALEGDALTLREGDELAHYELGRREALWRARVPGAFYGAPAARDLHLFAGWYDASGTAHLAWLERATGKQRGDLVLGRHRGAERPEREALTIVPHERALFVHLPPGLPATSGQVLDWARVPFDGATLGSATLHGFLAAPLELERGWVAPERLEEGGARWVMVESNAAEGSAVASNTAQRGTAPGSVTQQAIELASREHHAWLSASTAAASRAGAVLYLGPCAADERTREVLWRRERAPDQRPVPVPGGLLVIEGDRLLRLGGPERAPERADERARACVTSEERTLGERLLRLASESLRVGAVELAQRLVVEAEGLGALGRNLELVRAEAERATPAPSSPRAGQRQQALLADEKAARADLLRALAEAAASAPDSAERRALLGELFRRAPDDPDGLAILSRLLPHGARATGGTALSWLEFLAVSTARPIELVPEPRAGESLSSEQRALAAERTSWRADALGYQSERLLVLAAEAPPGAVARTIQAGELVCDLLEHVFEGGSKTAGRLELVLYPTRDEYLAHSGTDLGGLESVLGFTAGHFDLGARVSRLFLPEDDANDARLRAVSVHELTHHWLATRSRFGPPRAAPTTKGFWVVEAIATWAEELRLDLERGSWSSAPARAASVDTVAHAGARDLLDWRALLAASFEDFKKLETRPTCTLSLDWQLGARAPRSPMQLFYAQGGALAHYLYEGAGPEGRALLFRAVEAYYRGGPEDVAAALGTAAEDLGARVVAWARGTTAQVRTGH